jgi:hypothetical protein
MSKPVYLVLVGAYGRDANVLDWDTGKDFKIAVRPAGFPGGTYCSRRDLTLIRDHGVTEILLIKSSGEGFILEVK